MTEVDALGAYTPKDEVVDGIPKSELWSLDMTLTDYILPRLRAFKSMERHGYPLLDGFDDDDAVGLQVEWEYRLDKMIVGFEAMIRLTDGYEKTANEAVSRKLAKEGLALFAQHYSDLWD